jgi:hypothetical protein
MGIRKIFCLAEYAFHQPRQFFWQHIFSTLNHHWLTPNHPENHFWINGEDELEPDKPPQKLILQKSPIHPIAY